MIKLVESQGVYSISESLLKNKIYEVIALSMNNYSVTDQVHVLSIYLKYICLRHKNV